MREHTAESRGHYNGVRDCKGNRTRPASSSGIHIQCTPCGTLESPCHSCPLPTDHKARTVGEQELLRDSSLVRAARAESLQTGILAQLGMTCERGISDSSRRQWGRSTASWDQGGGGGCQGQRIGSDVKTASSTPSLSACCYSSRGCGALVVRRGGRWPRVLSPSGRQAG